MRAVFEDWCFNEKEIEFINYFDKLLETDKTFPEIEKTLPEINKHYQSMVEKTLKNGGVEPGLRDLFRNWRAHRADHNPHRSEKQ